MVIESPLNMLGAAAAYSHLERLLGKMEALTGALPASYKQHEAVYRSALPARLCLRVQRPHMWPWAEAPAAARPCMMLGKSTACG